MGDPALSGRFAQFLTIWFVLFKFLSFSPQPFLEDAYLPALQIASKFSPIISLPANPSQAELVQTIQFKHWELVTALAWSPDQKWLVVAAGNRLLGYQTETWQPAWQYPMPALSTSLAFSPDGRWLAAGSRDGKVRIWANLQALAGSAEPSLVIEAHKKGVNSVAFDPSSRFLASGGNDAVARFWDPASGENLGQMIGGTFAVPSIAFSPDGLLLAVTNGSEVRLREVGTERIVGTIQASQPLFSLAFHPQDNFFVTGSTENQVELWDAAQAFRTGQERYPDPTQLDGHKGIPNTYRSLVWQVVFNPQGSLFATAGGDAVVRVWDYEQKSQVMTLNGHRLAVSSLSFSPDGQYLASGSLDASVRIWRLDVP